MGFDEVWRTGSACWFDEPKGEAFNRLFLGGKGEGGFNVRLRLDIYEPISFKLSTITDATHRNSLIHPFKVTG